MRYHKGNGKYWRKFFTRGRRPTVLMINVAVVLVAVIIAMVVQLVHLDRQQKPDKAIESRAVVTEVPELPEEEEDQGQTAEPTPSPEIERIRKDLDKDKPMVALTFDDGPYDVVTDRLVKILAKNDSRATFFVVGNRIAKFADSMKNAYENGNQIGTHTYDHCDLGPLKKAAIKRQLKLSVQATKNVIGVGPAMLRPPFGNVSDTMRKVVDMPMINWCVDTEDWLSRNKKAILKRCKSIQDGDIVLMHDLYPSTANAVAALVPRLRKKGFQLVTVEELFYYKGIDAENGKVYYSGR